MRYKIQIRLAIDQQPKKNAEQKAAKPLLFHDRKLRAGGSVKTPARHPTPERRGKRGREGGGGAATGKGRPQLSPPRQPWHARKWRERDRETEQKRENGGELADTGAAVRIAGHGVGPVKRKKRDRARVRVRCPIQRLGFRSCQPPRHHDRHHRRWGHVGGHRSSNSGNNTTTAKGVRILGS